MPRRVSRKPKASHTPARRRTKEPLAEGIRKERRPYGFFSKMKDEELIDYAKKFMKEKGISRRGELQKVDNGLYKALRRRKLLNKVGFEEKRRDWASMSEDEIVAFTNEFMKKNGISGRGELEKVDGGLYNALRKRKLLDEVRFEEKRRDWASMSYEELVSHAKRFMKEKGISEKGELQEADLGLYKALRRRKLLNKVGFEEKRRDWASMSDEELVSHAKRFMKEKGISSSKELEKADVGLYSTLQRRKLLDKICFDEKQRDWASMSDDEIFSYTRKFMKEKRITGRSELKKADSGLYKALLRRKLLNEVEFERKKRKRRDWASMSDGELVAFARRFMKEKKISRRYELEKTDRGLYKVLQKRKLRDRVFAPIEKTKQMQADDEVIRVLEEFGGAE